jgi:hypothetical protein
MNADPAPVCNLNRHVTPALERIVRTCLAKDPEDRWQSVQDIALELKFVAESSLAHPPHAKQFVPRIWPWFAGVFLSGILILVVLLRYHPQQGTPLVQFEITAPAKSEFSGFGSAISPNGRYVAFVAVTEAKERLWLRPLAATRDTTSLNSCRMGAIFFSSYTVPIPKDPDLTLGLWITQLGSRPSPNYGATPSRRSMHL